MQQTAYAGFLRALRTGLFTVVAALLIASGSAWAAINVTLGTSGTTFTAPASVTLTATVTGGAVTKVMFYANGDYLDQRVSGIYSLPLSNVPANTYQVHAVGVDANNQTYKSNTVTVTVHRPPTLPTVNVQALTSSLNYPGDYVVAATASGGEANGVSGTIDKVEFILSRIDSGRVVQTVPDYSAPYGASFSNIAVGEHIVTATVYAKIGSTAAQPVSHSTPRFTIKAVHPGVQIIAPAGGTNFPLGHGILIKTTTNGGGLPIKRVEFYQGSTKLTDVSTTPYEYNWYNAPLGTHTLKAKIYTDAGSSESGSFTINVVPPLKVTLTKPAAGTKVAKQPHNLDLAATTTGNGIKSVAFFVRSPGQPDYNIGFANTNGTGNYATSVLLTGTPAGPVQLYAVAKDGTDGNGTTLATSDLVNGTVSNVPPKVSASVTPANEAGTILLNGSASDTHDEAGNPTGQGQVVKLEAFVRTATGSYGSIPVKSISGTAGTLSFSGHLYSGNPGNYYLEVRATDNQASTTKHEIPFTLGTGTAGSVQGVIDGVYRDAGNVYLRGWACETGINSAIQIRIFGQQPYGQANSILIGSGTANLSNETRDDSNTRCGTNIGHRFKIDITAANTAGKIPLYVYGQRSGNGELSALSCGASNCLMPGTLNLGFTTPEDNARISTGSLGADLFLRAKVTGKEAGATIDKVEFTVEGEVLAGVPDTEADTYVARKTGLLARTAPYLVSASVTSGGVKVNASTRQVYVDAGGGNASIGLTSPLSGSQYIQGTPITLQAKLGSGTVNVKKVTFFGGSDGTTRIGDVISFTTGTDGLRVATLNWTTAALGSHKIIAKAYDTSMVIGTSSSTGTVISVVAAGGPGDATPIAITSDIEADLSNYLSKPDAGSLPGQLSVNGGAATFSLPISLPPGTNGMVPSVSLNYSSQARNGIAGLGWGLSGFSAIHRCNKTLVQDGVVGAVRFDLEDRLCLDGQRLTLVSTGTNPANDQDYWREDAEYRTEIETYSRITRSNTGGKLGFKVESKSGQIMYYGDSDNSQVDAQGRVDQQANSWAIRRTQDRNGNLVDYRYSKDSTRGEHLPVEIRWGGNDAANQAHYAKVSFVFSAQDRPDTEVGYLSGSKVTRSKLLEAIQTYTDTDAAGNGGKAGVVYTLTYGAPSPTSGRSRLESIQACEGAQVGSTPKCLPATRFGWGQPAGDASPKLLITSTRNGPDLVTKGMTGGNKYHHINQSDFDGDGRDDLLSDNWNLYQSTAGNWTHRPLTPVGGNATLHATAMLLGDYDGDGVTDVAYPDNGNLMVCRSTLREGGSGFTCSNWGAVATDGKKNPYMPADVDGDSRTDIVVRGSTGGKACISTGTGFTCKDWAQVSKVIPEPEQRPTMDEFPDPQADITPFSGDLNGDGLGDFVRVFPTGINANLVMEVQVCLTAKTGFDCSVWFSSTASSDVGAEVRQAARNGQLVQDLNGDGYADLLLMTDVKRLCYSTGKRFDCQLQAEILPKFGASHLTDVDADGHIDGMSGSYICRIWGTGNQCKNNADSQSPYGEQMVGDYDGDGRPDIAANSYTDRGQWQIASFANLALEGQALDRIINVYNGMGQETRVGYANSNLPTVYSRDAFNAQGASITRSYPQFAQAKLGLLANELHQGSGKLDNGNTRWLSTAFKYAGAAVEANGRGSLGFAQVQSTDLTTGLQNSQWINQTWPHIGYPLASRSVLGGVTLSEASHSGFVQKQVLHPNGAKTLVPVVTTSTSSKRDLNGAALGTTTSSNGYSDGPWVDLRTTSSTTTGTTSLGAVSHVTTTSTSYYPMDAGRIAAWRLGEIESTAALKSRNGSTPVGVQTHYTYNSKGQVETETVTPWALDAGKTLADYQVKTTYGRSGNNFGLVNTKTQAWYDPAEQANQTRVVEEVQYDSKGRFAETVYNAKRHQEIRRYDSRTGAQTSLTGPNGLTTHWAVDGFGRKDSETRADGSVTRYYHKQYSDGSHPAIRTVTFADSFMGSQRTAVPTLVFADDAGRQMGSLHWSYVLNGQQPPQPVTRRVHTRQTYDARGRTDTTYQPYFEGDTAYEASRQEYDDLNRVIRQYSKDEQNRDLVATNIYNGLLITSQNAKQQTKVDERDPLGQLIKTQDALGGITLFERDAWGNLVQTTDTAGNIITVRYDALNRKVELNDPNLGLITYRVNPLGQTWQTISPKQRAQGQATQFKFDELGRLINRRETDLISYWVYDTATKGIGQLASAYTCSGIDTSATCPREYERHHSYDSLGRPSTVTTILDTGSNGRYTSTPQYDAWGRLYQTRQQRGTDPVKTLDQRYDAYGKLSQYWYGQQLIWQAGSQDAAGRSRRSQLGNGLTVHTDYSVYTGRLQSDRLQDERPQNSSQPARLSEAYAYDVLGNVATRTQYWNGSEGFHEQFDYDSLNRLTESTVQAQAKQVFEYHPNGNLRSKTGVGSGDYVYPTQGPGVKQPHAVLAIPGLGSFSYDPNGNMETAPGRTQSWTSFDMPHRLSKGSDWSQFVYGPEHQRIKQTQSDGTQTRYAGSMEVEIKGSVTTLKTYWPAGLGFEREVVGSGTAQRYWTHTDRLGSVIGISNEAGELTQKHGYDAWGKRRNLNGSGTPDHLEGGLDNKGYTGHEMLDQLDLVHMNGRIYEPLIARFMSADPLIQEPEHSQSYNRYTYVWNNPTNMTDPTGFAANRAQGILGADTVWDIEWARAAQREADREPCSYLGCKPKGSTSFYAFDASTTKPAAGAGPVNCLSDKNPCKLQLVDKDKAARSYSSLRATPLSPEERLYFGTAGNAQGRLALAILSGWSKTAAAWGITKKQGVPFDYMTARVPSEGAAKREREDSLILTLLGGIGLEARLARSATASPSLNGPIFNPAGKVRAEKFADFQQGVSLRETIDRIAGDSPVVTYTASGKTLYTNPTTGKQVVYDNAGDYFRVEDTTVTGPLRYTDQFGNSIPNNVPLIKKNGVSETGVPADVRKALTHFTNTD